VFNPASILGYLEANDPELLADTAQAPYPAGEAGSFPTAGTWSWAIFNESENVEAGTALIRHLMQPENLQDVYEEVGGRWYPAYVDLQNEPFWAERPAFEYFPQILEDAREMWFPAEGTPLLITQLSAVAQRLILSDLAQAVTVGGADPERAVQEAQMTMEQIFEEVAANE
jgi:ABC-type glycerol-3-phosphate transport system substrate-binding protein